ncbi:hypothetical protein N7457_007754 [Penicillium paradoxum]|uniref:uncharacterized protein n=1 Tax=Penicillium paradoxum TaxID=176176 RepID=UPI0025475BC2|nr:uncharacterized protein N7457_007754 [Penicillium paradoxum]KAJ5772858.1 hypothetical protein N7457_007754 [Penicillium paradoxum]
MPKFQPSVFQNAEGKNFADPHSDRSDYYWVTVFIPEYMEPRWCTDEKILAYVRDQIRHCRCSIHEKAMHGLGKKCISIPIRRNDEYAPLPDFSQQPAHPDIYLAIDIAEFWRESVWANKIMLDKDLIFVAKHGKTLRMEDMVDVGLDIMNIWRI